MMRAKLLLSRGWHLFGAVFDALLCPQSLNSPCHFGRGGRTLIDMRTEFRSIAFLGLPLKKEEIAFEIV